MQALWDWFNGKKMIISAILGAILAFDEQVLINIWQVAWPWLGKFDDTISWFAMILATVGGVHKIVKAKMDGTTA